MYLFFYFIVGFVDIKFIVCLVMCLGENIYIDSFFSLGMFGVL